MSEVNIHHLCMMPQIRFLHIQTPEEFRSFEAYLCKTYTVSRICGSLTSGAAILPMFAHLKHPNNMVFFIH